MVKRNGEPVVTAATQVICLYKSHQRGGYDVSSVCKKDREMHYAMGI